MNSKRTTTSNGYEFWLPVSETGGVGHVVVLDGDKMKPRKVVKERKGGSGFGISQINVCFTLNTLDRHIVGIFK